MQSANQLRTTPCVTVKKPAGESVATISWTLDRPPIRCPLPVLFAKWQIFKEQLNTRVVLVALEIWTDMDHIPISVMPLEMLRDFSKYRQQSIKRHADAVHLVT